MFWDRVLVVQTILIRFSLNFMMDFMQGCEAEGSGTMDQVPEEWPRRGAITFEDYEMRYHPNSPVVLRGLHLHIRAGEKLGIVGRTGSGEIM